jgi:hypothetical protein
MVCKNPLPESDNGVVNQVLQIFISIMLFPQQQLFSVARSLPTLSVHMFDLLRVAIALPRYTFEATTRPLG